MKIREIRLQNGIFVYKVGISFTKWDFHLQRGTLALQTGLSFYISPSRSTFHPLKLKNNKKLSKNNKYILTFNNESCKV